MEKVSLLQSPAPPFPDKPPPAQKKFFHNNGAKSFPSRSTSFDLERLNKKSVSSRSFSVDYSGIGDKDFQLDKEKVIQLINHYNTIFIVQGFNNIKYIMHITITCY